MANKITVKFEAQGSKALKSAIDQLHLSQVRLEKGTEAYKRALSKLNRETELNNKLTPMSVRNNRLLGNTFATLRSKLLLGAFAMTLVNKTLGAMTRAHGEQELAEKKLEQALGRTSDELLVQASALQKITTFGDEATITAQSLLAAFIKDEDQLKKATVATLDLAAAKGMDLNSAADLVGKTLGSSTNSLSRYGIEVTGVVGSTERLDTLTKNIAKTFGGQAKAQAETLTGSIEQMKNAIGDTFESIGSALSPAVISLAGFFKTAAESAGEFFTKLTETSLDTTIRKLKEMSQETLRSQLVVAKRAESEAKARVSNLETEDDLRERIDNGRIAALDETNDRLAAEHFLIKEFGSIDAARLQALFHANDAYGKLIQKQISIVELSKGAVDIQDIGIARDEEKLALWEKYRDAQQQVLDIQSQINEQDDDFINNTSEQIKDTVFLSDLKWKSKMREIAMEEKLQNAMNATATQSMKSAGTIKTAHKDVMNAMVQEYVARQSLVIADAIASAFKAVPYPWNFVAAAGAGTAAGALLNTLAPKFETGGLIGGQRHSQGGTMIEAERGEFIMSRNAVESIGVNTLEAMNAGGGAVNINITGNVMSSDFVEGELADKITEAVRKGVDFGIS
tara:strand:- start:609 stop:2486 length:1878 start_codon:yes stop_codon:yes gene_type:complete